MAHQASDFLIGLILTAGQTFTHPSDIFGATVLIEFAFALQPFDRDGEADDAVEHLLDVIGRGIAYGPWLGASGFVLLRQPADNLEQARP